MARISRNLKEQFNIRLSPELLDGLRKMADFSDVPPSTIARIAIKHEVNNFLNNATIYKPGIDQ